MDMVQAVPPKGQSTPRRPVKRIARALGRLALVQVMALSLGCIAVYKEHHLYWNQSVPLRQATTLKLLGTTLPTALSVAIAQGDQKQLETLLNGSYEFYALVLTDSQGQRVLYTGQTLTSLPPTQLNRQILGSPFDPILSLTSPSTAIARVYYIQQPPLSFLEDVGLWLRFPDRTQRRFHIYTLTFTLWALWGLGVWATTEYLRRQQKQMDERLRMGEQSQRVLKAEAQQLRQLLTERSAQNTFLIERLKTARVDLETTQHQQHLEVQALQTAIADYENQIHALAQSQTPGTPVDDEKRIWQEELRQAKEKLRHLQQREAQTQAQVHQLTHQIQQLSQQRDDAYRRLEDLSQSPSDPDTLAAARLEIEQQQALANYAIEETTRLEVLKQELEQKILQLEQRNHHLSWRNQALEDHLETLGLETPPPGEDLPIASIPLSSLANISTRATVSALERLGFTQDHQTGSHIILKRRKEMEQSCSIPHKSELRPPTLKQILHRAGVTLEEFQRALK